MGGAPYIRPRLGDGPIFEVSVSQLDAKERPVQTSYKEQNWRGKKSQSNKARFEPTTLGSTHKNLLSLLAIIRPIKLH